MSYGLDHYTLVSMQNMEYKELLSALETTLFDAWDSERAYSYLLDSGYGHTNIHSGKSPEELARRLVNDESISAASCFETPEDAQDKIVCALLDREEDIARWLQADRRDLTPDEYRWFAFSVDMRSSEPVGYGFDGSFREKTTGAVRVVLEKDRPLSHESSKGCPCGFYIVTAYPDLHHKTAMLTGRRYTPEELANDVQGSENPLEKTETFFRESPVEPGLEAFVRFVPTNGIYPDTLKIKTRSAGQDICGYMSQGEIHMKRITDGKAEKLTEFDIATKYPKVAKYLSRIKNVYEKFSRGEKLAVGAPLKEQKAAVSKDR